MNAFLKIILSHQGEINKSIKEMYGLTGFAIRSIRFIFFFLLVKFLFLQSPTILGFCLLDLRTYTEFCSCFRVINPHPMFVNVCIHK